jgi:hypothetical protein
MSDAVAVEAWLLSMEAQFATGELADIEIEWPLPTVQITGSAPNDVVTVTHTLRDVSNQPIASGATSFVHPVSSSGGCCEIMQ